MQSEAVPIDVRFRAIGKLDMMISKNSQENALIERKMRNESKFITNDIKIVHSISVQNYYKFTLEGEIMQWWWGRCYITKKI